ncbi:unnamed protein product [Paramecium octaurelia]|uniref:Uncharacterized protein n=1 Tax=Paramecium octaurelia TaxID=43137 RepID=A0A8S1S3Q3_PAROT|nr:unnamed protein product [Paramecium octaurelia]
MNRYINIFSQLNEKLQYNRIISSQFKFCSYKQLPEPIEFNINALNINKSDVFVSIFVVEQLILQFFRFKKKGIKYSIVNFPQMNVFLIQQFGNLMSVAIFIKEVNLNKRKDRIKSTQLIIWMKWKLNQRYRYYQFYSNTQLKEEGMINWFI